MAILLLGVCFAVYGRGKREGNGDVISRERPVGEFTGLVLKGAVGQVNVHFSGGHRVVVTADSNIQNIVSTVSRNNTLTVNVKMDTGNAVLITDVYLPRLDRINLKGVGTIWVENGSSPDLQIRHTGVGTINAEGYRVENVTITGKGVGAIKVWAVDSLSGKWSGVGNVQYKGSPRINMNMDIVGKFEQLKQEEL
jgi:hypothetical protein